MIQRIQTVYLALVLILSFVGLISSIGEWTVAETVVAHFSNFTFGAEGQFKALDSTSGPWCLGILLILVMFLSAMSIMLFRKRMRQLRLTIISTILLVGYVAVYTFFVELQTEIGQKGDDRFGRNGVADGGQGLEERFFVDGESHVFPSFKIEIEIFNE